MSLVDELRLYSHFDGSTGLFLPSDLVRDNQMALNAFIAGGNVTAVPSGLKIAAKFTEVPLITTAWRALPTTSLVKRNSMAIQNTTADKIIINSVNLVGTTFGWVVNPNGEYFIDITDSIILFGRALTGTPTVLVKELS